MSEIEINEALAAHNQARRSARGVQRPDLTWSATLTTSAQKWANYLAEKSRPLHHDPNAGSIGQGENLWIRTYFRQKGEYQPFRVAVKAWVDEIKFYKGEKIPGGRFHDYGHYTQIIWPGTTKVGMASAYSRDRQKQYIVARYSPPGNMKGMTAFESSGDQDGSSSRHSEDRSSFPGSESLSQARERRRERLERNAPAMRDRNSDGDASSSSSQSSFPFVSFPLVFHVNGSLLSFDGGSSSNRAPQYSNQNQTIAAIGGQHARIVVGSGNGSDGRIAVNSRKRSEGRKVTTSGKAPDEKKREKSSKSAR